MSPFSLLFDHCRTPADFYRLQIRLENECAPGEIFGYFERRGELPLPAAKWAQKMGESLLRVGREVQPYRRSRLSGNVFLYQGEPAGQPKFLLVCFAGNFFRLMVPVAIFLQAIPASCFDVVVLRDPAKRFFLQGVPGYVADIRDLPRRLGQDVAIGDYAAVRCVGTSAGGAAALAAGVVFGADRAFAFGGGHPARVADELAGNGLHGREFDALFPSSGVPAGHLRCFFGAGSRTDREMAGPLCDAFPGVLPVAVADVLTHNLFFELFQQDRLASFLERNLLGGMDAPLEGPLSGTAPQGRTSAKVNRAVAARIRGAWKRFGGWDQAVYWGRSMLRLPLAWFRGRGGRDG